MQAIILPFFNDLVGFIGALGFWPLTVYFPVEMHIVSRNIPRWSRKWLLLQALSMFTLAISLAAAIGSISYVITDLKVGLAPTFCDSQVTPSPGRV